MALDEDIIKLHALEEPLDGRFDSVLKWLKNVTTQTMSTASFSPYAYTTVCTVLEYFLFASDTSLEFSSYKRIARDLSPFFGKINSFVEFAHLQDAIKRTFSSEEVFPSLITLLEAYKDLHTPFYEQKDYDEVGNAYQYSGGSVYAFKDGKMTNTARHGMLTITETDSVAQTITVSVNGNPGTVYL
ncbi:hypothetical protein C4573_05675 [Candidatus Woesearchaeota archaeon]|nr:MAG: hypothetical protein C4573_05675 [Candidatus Woesearchaeota archaeon]